MSSSRAVQIFAFIVAGAVALALVLKIGSRMLGGERGVGPLVQQDLALDAFDAIEVRNHADIELTVGGPQKVTVEGGERALSRLVASVEDHTLTVDSRGWHHNHLELGADFQTPRLRITVPSLTSLRVEGAGKFRLHQLKGPRFEFNMEGAGDLTADGAVDALSVQIDGAGRVNAADVQAKAVKVNVDGAAKVTVRALESLDASVDGIGTIVYLGNPRSVDKHVDGLGTIRPGAPDAAPPPEAPKIGT
jgi:hypothetical protein